MKRLFFLLFVFAFIQLANAQSADTTYIRLNQKIENLQNEMNQIKGDYGQRLNNIQIDLMNFNKQFRGGTSIVILGVATTIAGVIVATYRPEMDELITGLTIGGPVITLIGGIIQIDSFKYLGGKHSLAVRLSLIF